MATYSQHPATFESNPAPIAASNKGRVFGTSLMNAGAPAAGKAATKTTGVLTRAQARALAAQKSKPEAAQPVEDIVVDDIEIDDASDEAEAEALAEEVGEITLDPPALPRELENPQEVGIYINDIMRYFSKNEAKFMPSPSFLKQVQAETKIDASARATLVDWVVNVHRKFKLMKPVLALSVNILDRFLSLKPIKKDKLQLLGAASLLIASKFEEIYPPEIEDFVHISDRAFKKSDVIRMEIAILNVLKFEVSVPTSFVFMSRFSKVAAADEDTEKLAEMIVDASLLEYSMLKYLPSVVTTSALVLAQKMLNRGRWTAEMQAHTGYTQSALTPCIKDLVNVLKGGYHKRMTSLTKKYGEEKCKQVREAAAALTL